MSFENKNVLYAQNGAGSDKMVPASIAQFEYERVGRPSPATSGTASTSITARRWA